MSFGNVVFDPEGHPRILNWQTDPKDTRDRLFSKAAFLQDARDFAVLPAMIDLRLRCSEVEDQGGLGSCTGQAVVGGSCEFLQRRSGNPIQLSRLFAYYNGRRLMGPWYIPQDSGCTIRTVIKAVARYGVCGEDLWPYDTTRFAHRPHDHGVYRCYTVARKADGALPNSAPGS